MKRIRKSYKWIFLATSIVILLALIFAYNIEKEYDTVIAGFFANEANVANNENNNNSTSVEVELNSGKKLCKEIIEEGAVLLKNDNIDNDKKSLPLSSDNKRINLFGYGATHEGWLQFGVGSGSTPPQANKSIDLLTAFDNSNYSYNREIINSYSVFNWKKRLVGSSSDTKKAAIYNQYEASRAWYESQPDLLENAKRFSDTAVFVISRVSGENTRTNSNSKESVPAEQTLFTDGATTGVRTLDRTYIQTSTVEEEVIDMLSENFSNVIILINSTNAMFLDKIDDRINSVLYVGITGENGASAIPDLLWGNVSPSGHLADTFPTTPKADPVFANRNDYSSPVFQESIYFGYKWYETADKMGFWESDFSKNNFNINNYNEAVFRPFGYGLSYSSFKLEIESIKMGDVNINSGHNISNNDEISVTVRVTNIGEVEAKEVVELYYEPPYYEGEIEKSSINLLDFDKTISLKPQESQNLTLKFKPYDMASFDTYDSNNNGFSGYELDKGTYNFSFRSDAHTIISDSLSFTLEIADNIFFNNDPQTGYIVKPILSGSEAYKNCSIDGIGFISNPTYLSRNNFASTFALSKTSGVIVNNSTIASDASNSDAKDYYNFDNLPTTSKESNLRLTLLEDGSFPSTSNLNGTNKASLKLNEELIKEIGNDYNNEKWDKLLDQMSFNEMTSLIYYAGFKTNYVTSVGKPQTLDIDGPSGFNGAFSPVSINPEWTSYPCQSILACTFSKRLAYNFGLSLGKDAQNNPAVNGLYGPGVNLHRSPFGSRNYEYYSEDRVLSGKLAANQIEGGKTNGLYMYMKHFICDEQGYNPRNVTTWLTEQSLREEYGRPFEIAIKEADANAIMSSFNKIGNIYVGHTYALCTTLLRNEWGFKGAIITDYYVAGNDTSMNAKKCVYAGNDMILNPKTTYTDSYKLNSEDVIDVNVARITAKHILYMYASTYSYSLTHEPRDNAFDVDMNINASEALSSIIPSLLLTSIIITSIILLAINVLNFIRPVVTVSGKTYMSDKETKIRRNIRDYVPIGLAIVVIIISLIAKSITTNSFFINFFSGVFADLFSSFTHFGFSVLMNDIIYIGIISFIGLIVLSIFKLKKDHSFNTILKTVSIFISLFIFIMSIGVLLFGLSSGHILKSLPDLLFILVTNILSIVALIISTIDYIKKFKK